MYKHTNIDKHTHTQYTHNDTIHTIHSTPNTHTHTIDSNLIPELFGGRDCDHQNS